MEEAEVSQHISGEVNQAVRYDYGEFIQIGDIRVRKEQMVCYGTIGITDDIEGRAFGVRFLVNGFSFAQAIGTREEAKKEVERIDWLFKRDERA